MPTIEDYAIILNNTGAKILISEDAASWVYARTSESKEVVRLYKDCSNENYARLKNKKFICAHLQNFGTAFESEEIYSITLEQGTLYTLEKRMRGINLSTIFAENRQLAAQLYIQAAQAVHALLAHDFFPIFTWGSFIAEQIRKSLVKNKPLLLSKHLDIGPKDVQLLSQAIRTNLSQIPEFSFIHGNLSMDSCLVDQQHNTIASIVNFGEDSVVGDARLDFAYLLFYTEISEQHRRRLATIEITTFIKQKYGDAVIPIINIYRIYLALTVVANEAHQEWALKSLACWQAILKANYIWQPISYHPPMVNHFRLRNKKEPDLEKNEAIRVAPLVIQQRPSTLSEQTITSTKMACIKEEGAEFYEEEELKHDGPPTLKW